jgi:hypothetical protein
MDLSEAEDCVLSINNHILNPNLMSSRNAKNLSARLSNVSFDSERNLPKTMTLICMSKQNEIDKEFKQLSKRIYKQQNF